MALSDQQNIHICFSHIYQPLRAILTLKHPFLFVTAGTGVVGRREEANAMEFNEYASVQTTAVFTFTPLELLH